MRLLGWKYQRLGETICVEVLRGWGESIWVEFLRERGGDYLGGSFEGSWGRLVGWKFERAYVCGTFRGLGEEYLG